MSGWRNEPIKSTGFDAQIKHEDGYELHFYTDRLEAYRTVEKVCQEQIDRKPKTRGDELRTMTDEELTEFLPNLCTHINPRENDCLRYGSCQKCVSLWLKQEVTDNDQR